jgi:hypothetical protein
MAATAYQGLFTQVDWGGYSRLRLERNSGVAM